MRKNTLVRFAKLLPVFVLVLILLTTAAMATEETFDTENFKGVVLVNTADNVTVKFFEGYTDSATEIEPVYTEGTTYYYEVEAGGKYYYTARPTSGYARYRLRQNLYITEEEAATKTVIDVTPHTRSTSGWDPSGQIFLHTDELMAHFPSTPDTWPAYADVFTTPVYTIDRNPHRQTTQTEMENFIDSLDDADDDMYCYVLGQATNKALDIPLVVFTKTDLSGAETLEEAAALVKDNGKLTVHYQAQIHGNEPAAGEAALAMLQRFDGEYGESLLDKMNIYVIPRLNVYGAYASKRYIDPDSTIDPNRDFMKLQTNEIQARMRAFNLFDPDLVIDGHEYNVHPDYSAVNSRDAMVMSSFIDWSIPEFKSMAIDLSRAAFAELEKNGLTYCFYDNSVSGGDGGNTGSCNTAHRGTLHVLIETEGISAGLYNYERRMMAQISSVEGVLNYAYANADAVRQTVDLQRQTIVNNGKTYEDSDYYIMKSSASDHPEYATTTKRVTMAGAVSEVTLTPSIRDQIERTRVLPTAYVIPAGEDYTETVLALMDKHGISYTFAEAGSTLMLQQYTGTVTEATLTAESAVTFPNGAYIFTMNQVDGYILAGLMEPDVDMLSGDKGTLVQQEIITATDGTFPIYRYIRDLNANGFVDFAGQAPAAPQGLTVVNATTIGGTGKITGLDAGKTYEYRAETDGSYTAVPAGSTEITGLAVGTYYVRFAENGDTLASLDAVCAVGYEALSQCVIYLDGVSGDDTNNGYTETAPVKTFETAQAQLDFLMQYAAEDAVATIMLTGNVTVAEYVYTMPAHDYPIVITGKTGAEELIHKAPGTSKTRYFIMGGDTTLENMTLTLQTSSSANYLCAGGHKLVIENSVKTVANSGGYFFSLIGGSNADTAGADITVKGGTWGTVYVSGYYAGVTGDATAILENCSVSRVTPSYSGTTAGDVYISLKNVTVKTELYCGNTGSGNVTGNVTLVLGEGVTSPKIYAGSRNAGNVGGTVTVVADGIDLTANTINGKANNDTGTIGGLKLVLNQGQLSNVAETFVTMDGTEIVLGCDQTEAVTLNYSCNLDLGGCDATITVADGKTLTVCDTATDDFKVKDEKGYGILTATGTTAAKEGYVVREETNGKSYHRRELKLDSIVLRPAAAGIYYTGQFGINELLQPDVASYGVVLSLNPDPELGKEGCKHSTLTQWPESGTGYGTVLQNIMTKDGGYTSNKANANMTVYGVAYVKYTDGTVEYSNSASYTLKQVVEASDTMWAKLDEDQKNGLLAMYQDFSNVMKAWTIPNIKAAA